VSLQDTFDSFHRLGLDPNRGGRVRDVVLEKQYLRLELADGDLFFLEPLEGTITGVLFIGRGRAEYRPPNREEAEQLELLSGEAEFHEPFRRLLLRFDDGTGDRLESRLEAASKPDAAARKILRRGMKAVENLEGMNLEIDFLDNLLSPCCVHPFFLADIETETRGRVAYLERQAAIKEIRLFHHESIPGPASRRLVTIWSETHRRADFDADGRLVVDPRADTKDAMGVRRYRSDLRLQPVHILTADVEMEFLPLEPERRSVRFRLANNFLRARWDDPNRVVAVRRVTDAAGRDLEYLHARHELLVRFPDPIGSEPSRLKFSIEAEVVIQITDQSYWIPDGFSWFPQHGWLGGRYGIDWTVRLRRSLAAIGAGRRIEETEQDRLRVYRWVSDEPIRRPSLIVGKFRSLELDHARYAEGFPERVTVHAFAQGAYQGWRRADSVLEEPEEILQFLIDRFGPFPYPKLEIVQMPAGLGYGHSPAGVVELTGEVFGQDASLGDAFHRFFAHEIAHQWWGDLVAPATTEDMWLSEALAEYAAGLFVRHSQGEDRFRQLLNSWEELARSADGEAPVVYAGRLRGQDAARNRNALIYHKGAYVAHMLACEIGEAAYLAAARRFLERHAHGDATVDEFRAAAETETGTDLGPFFRQWLHRTGIPGFRIEWSAAPLAVEGWEIQGVVEQGEGEDPKQVRIPVIVQLGNGERHAEAIPVKDGRAVFRFAVPDSPERLIADEDRCLLAAIEVRRHAPGPRDRDDQSR
jgi:hypothetical protein